MKLLVVVERTDTGYSAYSPDVPGCGATAPTRDEVEQRIQEVIVFHLDGLHAAGLSMPEPHSYATTVEVAA